MECKIYTRCEVKNTMVLETEFPDIEICLLEKLSAILGLLITNAADLEELSHWGVKPTCVATLVAQGFSEDEIDWIISPRRLLRCQTFHEMLNPEESRRLIQMARLFCLAVIVRDNATNALAWLRLPCYSYGGLSPMDLAKSNSGAYHVELLLRQLHSVP